MNKRIRIASMVGAGVVGLVLTGAAVSAATGQKPASLASEIAQKFHLSQSDVQAVIDQHKGEVRDYRGQRYEDRLNADVSSGKITAPQKDAILAEHNKLKAELDAARGSNPSDRRAAMQKVRQEALDWAKANNLDASYLMMGGPHGGHMGGMPATQ